MPDYQAITVWQPWATLIAEGAKRFEFRGWAPPQSMWGTRIAIHAGARPVRKAEVRELLLKLHSSYWRETGIDRQAGIEILTPILMAPWTLPLSSVLCIATLGAPVRNEKLAAELGTRLVNDSDLGEHTNFGWPLGAIEQLRPFVPAKGRQGFWRWSASA